MENILVRFGALVQLREFASYFVLGGSSRLGARDLV